MVETFAKSQYLLSRSTDSSINDSLSAVMIQFDEDELRVLCVDPGLSILLSFMLSTNIDL
jgi:hypothetical protein